MNLLMGKGPKLRKDNFGHRSPYLWALLESLLHDAKMDPITFLVVYCSSGLVGLSGVSLLCFGYLILNRLHDLGIRLKRAVGLNGWRNESSQE